MLLVNYAANSNHWLGLAVKGIKSNRDGIGAKVTVRAGGRSYVQEVRSGSSYISSSDLRLHFGIGPATSIDHIEVRWPSGTNETFPSQGVDHIVTLVEGTGTSIATH